jgi:hypothetical protein
MTRRFPFTATLAGALLLQGPALMAAADSPTESTTPQPASASASPDAAVTLAKARPRSLSLEVAPFLSALDPTVDVPGPVGIGIGLEALLKDGLSVSGLLGYSQLRRSAGQINRAQENGTDTNPVGAKLDAEALQLALRYYVTPEASSWFAGAGAAASRGTSVEAVGAERVSKAFAGGYVTLEGGYRWLWSNGFTVRLTGLGHSRPITKADLKFNGTNSGPHADVDADTRDEITGVIPELRLGFGLSL